MTSKLDVVFLDACNEKGSITLNMPDLSAGNFATQIAKIALTGGTLVAKIAALTLCNAVKSQLHVQPVRATETLPTGATAVRELALLVTYQDTVTSKKYRMAIPGIDTTKLVAGTDNIDPTDADWTAFVTQFEADVLSEAGNAVTVLGGRLVGRNN